MRKKRRGLVAAVDETGEDINKTEQNKTTTTTTTTTTTSKQTKNGNRKKKNIIIFIIVQREGRSGNRVLKKKNKII